jgi:uncharacterized protein YndB with AHSA1/START domain
MDRWATLAYPLERVFDHLAAPACLGDWLPDIAGTRAGARAAGRVGVSFTIRIRQDGAELPGQGELIAYEPPWSAAYRLVTDLHTHVLRITCVSTGGTTRVHIHQSEHAAPMTVDLARLRHALAGQAGGTGHP